MTDFLAFPPVRAVRGSVHAPASKSATNRALLLAALSSRPVEIVRPLDSQDTRRLGECLTAMGAVFEPTAAGWRVHGPLGRGAERDAVTLLDVGASGTAARFLTAVAAAVPGNYSVTGEERLRERPMAPLVSALSEAGAEIAYAGREGFLPLSIRGGTLGARLGRPISVDASGSSQFVSALLLAAAAAAGALSVRPLGKVVSAPYVEGTINALRAFGHEVTRDEDGTLTVTPGDRCPGRFEVPGDWSSALPFLAAAGIAGGEVTVTGLEWPSADADARALDAIEATGVAVDRSAREIRARSDRGPRRTIDYPAGDFPDAVPVLAALAAFAHGESRFREIAHLRWKESDRLAALGNLLRAAGVSAAPGMSEIAIAGPPRPREGLGRLPTFRDHRIAMAASLLALRLPGALIEDPRCVAKSYPGFFRDLETILLRG